MSLFAYKIYNTPNYIPSWDGSHHLSMGFKYFSAISNQSFKEIYTLYAFSGQLYPPIYHILIAVSYLLFGVAANNGLYVNVAFIPVLIYSSYLLGSYVYGKKVGIISAFLVPLLPLFLYLQEVAYIDYMNISLFVLSFYIMFKTDYFRSTKYSVLFGVLLFINLLTKWPIVIPSIPFFIYLTIGLISFKKDRYKIFLNLQTIFIFLILALTWYYSNYPSMVQQLDFFWNPNNFAQKIWDRAPTLSLENIILYIYPYAVGNKGFGIIPLSIFFVSIFLKNGESKNKRPFYLVASILITYVVLTYLNDKADKYIGYIYPLIIIYTLGKLLSYKQSIVRNVLITTFCLSILLNVLLLFTNTKPVYLDKKRTLQLFPGYQSSLSIKLWPTKSIVEETISKYCKGNVLVLTDNKYLNRENISYFALINNIDILALPGNLYYDPSESSFKDMEIAYNFNCIISKSGNLEEFANRTVVNRFENFIEYTMRLDEKIFTAPDGSLIKVYYRQQ